MVSMVAAVSEQTRDGERDAGRPDVVVGAPRHAFSAGKTEPLIVPQPGIAHAQKGFEPPVAGESPAVSVGESAAGQAAVVDAFAAAGAVLRAVEVNPEEVALETPAQPVAQFGLHEPEGGIGLVTQPPRPVGAEKVQGHPTPRTDLHSDVGGRCRPVECVGLQRKLLGGHSPDRPAKDRHHNHHSPHSIATFRFDRPFTGRFHPGRSLPPAPGRILREVSNNYDA